jgi:hypothetical protein
MRQHWYNPWRVFEAGVDCLSDAWQSAAPSQAADSDWITPWIERAAQMTLRYASEEMVGYDDLQTIMRESLRLRDRHAQEQDRLTNQLILPLYRQLYPDCLLESFRSIGLQSAAIYMAFIQYMAHFLTVEKFASGVALFRLVIKATAPKPKGCVSLKRDPTWSKHLVK